MYNDELIFEHDLVEALKENGWTDGVLKNPTEKDLLDNWAKILFENNRQKDRLGDYPLTDTEMQQIIEKITALKTPLKLNGFINGKTTSIIRDNPDDLLHKGKEVSLKIYDREEIAAGQSRYQIAEQPMFDKSNALLNNRRGDIMLLINGMPLFHIELKKSNISVKQATNQIEKYFHEGIYKGIYSLVQIFVAMTPEETLYFANPGNDGTFNPSFYFNWEDFNNEIINDWKEITRKLLSIPMAHQLIGFYTVADDTDGVLKVMRSYQYYAANKISDVVSKTDWTNPNIRGGYIWHTTGSGKTMTSFKSAQLISNSKDADKVIFLMDRIELGTQSLDEYKGFADNKDDVTGTEDTKDLITKLKSDDPAHTLIVTSIQKMSLIKDVTKIYKSDIEIINKKRIVIIVDECHRDTFGIMMSSIRETFPKAIFFGFTGTPIFDENKKKSSVTTDIFGNELHRYTIADGIRDKNVLGFDKYKVTTFRDIDIRKAVALDKCKVNSESEVFGNPIKENTYYKFINELEMCGTYDNNGNYIKGIEDYIPSKQYDSEIHREKVVDNILENWNRISRNNMFSAILATSCIPEAIEYYRLLKNKNAFDLFKFTVLVDPNIDNTDSDKSIFKEDGLVEVLKDYNEMYAQSFSLSTSAAFKKDVSNRLAHKKQYKRILEKDKLGLLIVVDQMLTGFDSKWLNALYLDKVLQYENIIQAFSRTNRVYQSQEKPFGIVKYYRKPYTMERNVATAIKAYSGDKPFQLFVPKLHDNIENMNIKYKEIKDLFKEEGIENFESLPREKEIRRKFVKLYNEFNQYLCSAMIQGYIPNKEDVETSSSEKDNNIKVENSYIPNDSIFMVAEESVSYGLKEYETVITIQDINAMKQRYKEVATEDSRDLENDIPYDIDGYLIEIDDGKIDSDYMNNRFEKYLKKLSQDNCTKEELEEALGNLHKSFASLPKVKQKYANLLLNDINSGDIVIESGKTFMDYITEYETKISNDQIKKIANYFGLNEEKLRTLKSLPLNESNLNEYNRFDDLLSTVDKIKAKASLEKLYNKELRLYEVHMEINKILRDFVLSDGFDIETLSNKVDQ